MAAHARAALLAGSPVAWPIIIPGHYYLITLKTNGRPPTATSGRRLRDIDIIAYQDTLPVYTSKQQGRDPAAAARAIISFLNVTEAADIPSREGYAMPLPSHRKGLFLPPTFVPTNSALFTQTDVVCLFSTAAHIEMAMCPRRSQASTD